MTARTLVVLLGGISLAAWAQDAQALRDAARGGQPGPLKALAEHLDRRHDPEARGVYEKLLATNPDADTRQAALRRLVVQDLLVGDKSAAARHLQQYRQAGGTALPASLPAFSKPETMPTIDIPGPIGSFSRMAALSPDLKPEDILPALARNVVTNGYQASNSQEAMEQTEYLKLVFRYLVQARELEKFAGVEKKIVIEQCDSAKTGELLKILGYRIRGACGGDLTVETVNAGKAFLTIDSGFPLAELEQALRTSRPFAYDFKPTPIPVMWGPEYWLSAEKKDKGEFIDTFLSDPLLCRLYLGMAKLDAGTAQELKKAVAVTRLRAFAHVIDFFGGMYLIRDGKAVVPGAPRSEAAWADLVGAPPSQGAQFLDKLFAKDDGWMNSYFDSLSRIEGPVLTYLTDPDRMKRFYGAIRGRVTSPGPARPVFRSNTDLMLLTTRLRMEADGRPHLPGGIELWRNLFIHHPHGKWDGKLTKSAQGWKTQDDVIEALFGLSRKAVENEPLKIFMGLTDINRRRAKPLATEVADRIARNWRIVSSQVPVFTEADLSDAVVGQYLDLVESINSIKDQGLRADTAGCMQGLVSIWQILARNSLIPAAQVEGALKAVLDEFGKSRNEREVFDGGVKGVRALLKATGTQDGANQQERMIELLAGAANRKDDEAHQQMVSDMNRIFESQRLISLKTLLDLADHIEALGKGEKLNVALVNRLQQRMQDIQLPRASLTAAEKNALSFGYWTEKHIEAQRRISLRQNLERAGAEPGKLADARASLAPILRDTLVGFSYLYYAPPGAQLLKTNPLFVRSHDFLGVQGTNQTWRQTEVLGTGWPSSAGGRLVGSLAGLAYALAEAEQNFLVPTREQALIWGDLVPQMILMSKIGRWWQVTPEQLHFVGLHFRQGESVVAEAMLDPGKRKEMVGVLGRQASPGRVAKVDMLLAQGDLKNALDNITASELVLLGKDHVAKHETDQGLLAQEIRRLRQYAPATVNWSAISRAFGTPKPTLTSSYHPELLELRTFPTLMGYSSRIMAESWESNLLYYATIADEVNMNPARLNVAIPEWTAETVQRIFATHLEDWPALLRSLRTVGEDVRMKVRKGGNAEKVAGE
jgi:hypothetical protein